MIDQVETRRPAVAGASCPLVPVSWGELLDKITILEIKQQRLRDDAALEHVRHELALLAPLAAPALADPLVKSTMDQLRAVNLHLWMIEDDIREEERAGTFGERFIEIARSVYKRNDERGSLKREINIHLESSLVEEKSFESARIVHAVS